MKAFFNREYAVGIPYPTFNAFVENAVSLMDDEDAHILLDDGGQKPSKVCGASSCS